MIRAFGIFNTNVSEDNQMLYGIPFPGDYLIAPDGTVRDKVFLPNYQYRPTVSELMLRNFAEDSGATAVEVVTSALTARISLSTDHCFPGQELGVALKFSLRPGWHVYGKPLPDNYRHLEVVFDGEIVGRQSFEFPPARPMMLKALGENAARRYFTTAERLQQFVARHGARALAHRASQGLREARPDLSAGRGTPRSVAAALLLGTLMLIVLAAPGKMMAFFDLDNDQWMTAPDRFLCAFKRVPLVSFDIDLYDPNVV